MKPEEAIEMFERVKKGNIYLVHQRVIGKEVYEDYSLVDMAIDALKKQIPVKPKHIDKNAEFDGNWKKVCPTCGRALMERITTPEMSYPRHYNMNEYCCCGQKILWEQSL